jgi:hypothetical protein
MGTSENVQHLLHSSEREALAVEQMLRMLPQICPAWHDSLDLDSNRHWALVKPVFKTPTCREPEAEIDVILGRMASLVDSSGAMKPIWPPSTDYLVAIEAKCLAKNWDDIESWAVVPAKSNLTQQLKRDIELGFSCVSALHVIATPPDAGSFAGAMDTANRFGNHFLLEAERQANTDVEGLAVGHCVFSVGEVSWKPSHQAGALLLLKLKTAPQIEFAAPIIRNQVDSILSKTPTPRYWRPLYAADETGAWRELDDLFAPLCSQS